MRSIHLHLLLTIAVLVIFYTITTASYQISLETPRSPDNLDATEDALQREKRELENFDDEYPSASSQDAQEEPSFWDRVVKVALKLFSKFIEWLNS